MLYILDEERNKWGNGAIVVVHKITMSVTMLQSLNDCVIHEVHEVFLGKH